MLLRNFLLAVLSAASLAAFLTLKLAAQDTPSEAAKSPIFKDPIAFAAYHKLFDAEAKEVKATPEFLRKAIDGYIGRLLSGATTEQRAASGKIRKQIDETIGADEFANQSVYLERLIEELKPADIAHLHAKNRTLRIVWYEQFLGKDKYWELADKVSGLPKDIAEKAEKGGMLQKATTSTGPQYIKECREAGVPIPPDWGDEGPGKWNFVGDLTPNFLGSGNPAKVYRYESTSPDGVCIALPRLGSSTMINLLGVICAGRKSSNVCFFDNSQVRVGDRVPFDQFLSGGNLGDVCSDCHAGENPFIVHPGSALAQAQSAPFTQFNNKTDNWHVPLVKPTWPQNPGPFTLLDLVAINSLPPSNDSSCLSCHQQSNAGRFPDILALNAGGFRGYCGSVLTRAMGNTMPGGPPYQKHVNAMRAFCQQSLDPGSVVDVPNVKDDPAVVSAPIVMGPIYACTSSVEVRGGVRNAKLVVRINGVDKAGDTISTPSSTIIDTGPLSIGDVVDAYQDTGTVVSGLSQSVTVQDHTIAYPNGLPAPSIDPTVIHQCGHTIAVRHVRGSNVTILTNGGNPAAYTTGSEWTNLAPALRPFGLGDKYTARQQICSDVSPDSIQQVSIVPPNPMPVPRLQPATPVSGQELIAIENMANGALTTVYGSGGNRLSQFSTAIDRIREVDVARSLGRPLQAGESLALTSALCDATKIETPPVEECKQLSAPEIVRPFVGDNFVRVSNFVPGARIKVFDSGAAKIGDGSGSLVALTRRIRNGDVLTVMQSFETCVSGSAYRIAAVCASDKCE